MCVPRALLPVDPAGMPTEAVDVLVVGSGVAGLTVAAALAGRSRVALVTKGRLGGGSTAWAQGGIAAAVGLGDSPEAHLDDTLAAGAGLSEPAAVRVLVEEAADAIDFLYRQGARLDEEEGRFALTLEGGHGRPRVLHAGGDATGAEVSRALLAVATAGGCRLLPHAFVVDLLTDVEGTVLGVLLWAEGSLRAVRAGAVVLASGGVGQLFAATTAPPGSTGDGAAAALRAGAVLADMEFVQFHPTALHRGRDPRPLVSEAVRGEGAVLRDPAGQPVTAGVHPRGDLAPRDVVARAMVERMDRAGLDHLYLDATGLGRRRLERRFPTVVDACRDAGVDPARDWIPVSPAAHYTIGGVRTDMAGRTSLPGLFAVGEVASTGVHGANRLASNSLLEGMVVGRRVAAAVTGTRPATGRPTALTGSEGQLVPDGGAPSLVRQSDLRGWLRRAMTASAGVVRDGDGLAGLHAGLVRRTPQASCGVGPDGWEVANLFVLAATVTVAAASRRESRGAHWRRDAPGSLDAWRVHQTVARNPEGSLVLQTVPVGAAGLGPGVTGGDR